MTTDDRSRAEVPSPPHSHGTEERTESGSSSDGQKRNPLEKILVWGVIGVLALVAGYEAAKRFGHEKSIAAVDDAYRASVARMSEYFSSEEVQADARARIEQGMSPEAADAAAVAAAIERHPERGRRITLPEAEALMSGFPSKSVNEATPYIHDVTYRWKTHLKDYGGLRIRYQIETKEVLNVNDFAAGEDA